MTPPGPRSARDAARPGPPAHVDRARRTRPVGPSALAAHRHHPARATRPSGVPGPLSAASPLVRSPGAPADLHRSGTHS